MKKNIIHVLWMALAVCATSCNDLDEVVYSSVTEQTYSYSVNDFIPNIAGAYEPLHADYVGGLLANPGIDRLLHRDSTEFHRLG